MTREQILIAVVSGQLIGVTISSTGWNVPDEVIIFAAGRRRQLY